jgi:2-desacetyl-2-hydroxyethyl bacteriochlorophyllide A dehydrogenase
MIETSVVIRTYNEEKHLPALFDGLDQQSYRNFETVVVDSGSFDLTREIAHKRATRLVRISRHDFTFGYSLNEGIRHSNGRLIVIVSAHTRPTHPDWLAFLIAPLREHSTAMVYGRQLGEAQSKFGELLDFERTFGPLRKILTPPNFMANNANSAIRRELWEQHPFAESLPGLEDIEWARYWMERGYQVVYEPTASIYHIHEENWEQVRRRYYREGLTAKWIGLRKRRDLPGEILRETRCLFGDLRESLRQRCFRPKVSEILRFRYEKMAGTIAGVWDGAMIDSPANRERLLFQRQCKAVVIHAPGRASLCDIELPQLKPGEVLIKVAYEGVCGTDLEIFEGTLGYYKSGKAHYPITPGHEFSGRVVEVGYNVKGIREGDRVVAECIQTCGECPECHRWNFSACERRQELGVINRNGAYAEYVIVPGQFVHRLPEEVPLRHATLCEPLAVVLKGIKRLGLNHPPRIAKRCAVIGAGPIGHLCAKILAMEGHGVAVYDRSLVRLSYFDNTNIEVIRKLDDLTDFEILIDATGDPEVLDVMLHNSGAGTSLLLLGLPYARREFNFEALVSYDKTIVGSVGSSANEFEEAIRLLPRLDLHHFNQQAFRLEEFEQAWSLFKERRYLKLQLAIDEALDRPITMDVLSEVKRTV